MKADRFINSLDLIEHSTLITVKSYTELSFDEAMLSKIRSFCLRYNISISFLLSNVYKALLHRYTGQDNIVLIDTSVEEAQKENNTLTAIPYKLTKTRFDNETLFQDLLNKDYIIQEPNPFILNEDFPGKEESYPDRLASEYLYFYYRVSALDEKSDASHDHLNFFTNWFEHTKGCLIFKEYPEGIKGSIYYNKTGDDSEPFKLFASHFTILLDGILKNPDTCINAYNILSPQERRKILFDFNNTQIAYSSNKQLHTLFEDQVLLNAENVALRKGEQSLSYEDLNKYANQLAHLLIIKGIKPKDNVGLVTKRGFEMIIAMLAIMKSGAAYVPIDPDYPVERQAYIFTHSSLTMVVADQVYPVKTLLGDQYLVIDFAEMGVLENQNPGVEIESSDLAYTIYTSGSTGNPKGVMIEHHAAVNLIEWVNKEFSVTAADSVLFITSMCFDLSVYDIFGILAAGGQVIIAERQQIQDVDELHQMLVNYDITFWDSVPTTIDYLVSFLEKEKPDYSYNGLKTIFMSGDWIPVSLPERLKTFFPEAEIISLGGATEGTIWSNYYPIKKTNPSWKSIPYGKPISNNLFYILNDKLQPVPVGVSGELYIGGVGVARGYANDKVKTSASFVPDIFNNKLGGMMYRTGDIGKMKPDFNMEFLGRRDNQIKINGFRIELGEIENILRLSDLIKDCVALVTGDLNTKKSIRAYVIPERQFETSELITYLKFKLPHYMIPGSVIKLDRFPLTSNGKIDRKTLAGLEEESPNGEVDFKATTETEKLMISIWKTCMNLTEVSTRDNFFELGGHSLMAIQILTKFEKQTKIKHQLAVFFKYPTIEALSKFIDENRNDSIFKCLVPIKPTGSKPPLYIVHGKGLHVLEFSNLAASVDKEQPIFGFQAIGLNGIDVTPDNMQDIAKAYISELLLHNQHGPYLIAGHSFGGYIAAEMHRQLKLSGKNVKMLIVFDTNVETKVYKWFEPIPKKMKRQFNNLKIVINDPKKIKRLVKKNQRQDIFPSFERQLESKDFFKRVRDIEQRHETAFKKYHLKAFDDKVHLIKAEQCIHFIKDVEYLGWKKYATQGVTVHLVPGNHTSMLFSPHIEVLAKILQNAIDDNTN